MTEEQDRRSGLLRVLESIRGVADQVTDLRAAVAELSDRVDRLETSVGTTAAAPLPIDISELRRTVQAAVAQLDVPTTADQVQALVNTALSVIPPPRVDDEAVARAVRSAVGALPTAKVDLGPVLDAVGRHEQSLSALAGATDLRAVRDELATLADNLDVRAVRDRLGAVASADDVAHLYTELTRLGAGLDLASLAERIAALDDAVHGLAKGASTPVPDAVVPVAGADLSEAVVDLVRRSVTASHRALATQLRALFDELRSDLADDRAATVAAVLERAGSDSGSPSPATSVVDGEPSLGEVARDIEAIRRAIERAGFETR